MKKHDDFVDSIGDTVWEKYLKQQVLQTAIKAVYVVGTLPSNEVFDFFKYAIDALSVEDACHILPKWLGGSVKTVPLHSDPIYKKWLKKAMLLRITK